MKRSTTTWTLAVTAAALLMLPASGAAQTPPSPPSAAQPPAAAQPQPPAADTAAAREHLAKAKLALNDIQAPTLNAKAKTQVAELKRRINTLERSIGANDEASATGTDKRSPTATAGAKGKVNWGTEVAAIDKTLTMMLGPDSATGAPAATGTSGTAAGLHRSASRECRP